jgi:hypothetical protein
VVGVEGCTVRPAADRKVQRPGPAGATRMGAMTSPPNVGAHQNAGLGRRGRRGPVLREGGPSSAVDIYS